MFHVWCIWRVLYALHLKSGEVLSHEEMIKENQKVDRQLFLNRNISDDR